MATVLGVRTIGESEQFKVELCSHEYLDPMVRLSVYGDRGVTTWAVFCLEDLPELLGMLEDLKPSVAELVASRAGVT